MCQFHYANSITDVMTMMVDDDNDDDDDDDDAAVEDVEHLPIRITYEA